MDNFDEDKQAVIDTICGETEAFYRRDFDAWADYWMHIEAPQRLGVLAGGFLDFKRGWADHSDLIRQLMNDYPDPNPEASSLIRRENIQVRICESMAWASYDQIAPRSDDVFVNVGLSYQTRILEQNEGRWKLVFAAYGETQSEYFDCPAICVTASGKIRWENTAASLRLDDHPILVRSGGYLRSRSRANQSTFVSALERAASFTPMDIRLSINSNVGNKWTIPLVFQDMDYDTFHILWVSQVEGAVVVSFEDHASESRRLTMAHSLFGLSNSQRRLANLIVEGRDLVEAAEHMGITVNTARTHLQRIFGKTGVRSQTALVRQLLNAGDPPT